MKGLLADANIAGQQRRIVGLLDGSRLLYLTQPVFVLQLSRLRRHGAYRSPALPGRLYATEVPKVSRKRNEIKCRSSI